MKSVIVLIFSAFCGCAFATDSDAVLKCLREYRAALKSGNVDRAIELTAIFPNYPITETRRNTERFSELAQAGELSLWIFPTSVRVEGDCAVVIVGDGQPAADDPAYLILQDEAWKLFPDLTQWDEDYFELTEDQRERLTVLATHVAAQKKELRAAENPIVE